MSDALAQSVHSDVVTQALEDLLPSFRPGVSVEERDAILQTVADRLTTQLADRPDLLDYLLGLIDYTHGDYAAAEVRFRRILSLPGRPDVKQMERMATTLNSLAVMLQKQGKRTEAEPLYRQSLEFLTKLYGPEHENLDSPRANYAFVLRRLGKLAESESYYRQAYEIQLKRHGKSSIDTALKAEELLVVLLEEGKAAEAEPLARETLAVLEQLLPQGWQYSNAQSLLGGCSSQQRRFDEAEPLLLSGYAGLHERVSTNSALGLRCTGEAIRRLVQHFTDRGAPAKAAEWEQKIAEWNKQNNAMMMPPAEKKPEPGQDQRQ
jgi:tetratricopeptide (TPR) repeat protein